MYDPEDNRPTSMYDPEDNRDVSMYVPWGEGEDDGATASRESPNGREDMMLRSVFNALKLNVLERSKHGEAAGARVVGESSTVCTAGVIDPSKPGRFSWDLVTGILVLTDAVLVPLQLAFNTNVGIEWFWLTTVYFIVDILLNFNTGFYKNGVFNPRRKEILFNYVRGFFIVDFMSTMPWDYMINAYQAASGSPDSGSKVNVRTSKLVRAARISRTLRLVRLLRLLKLRSLKEHMEDIIERYKIATMARVIGILIIFAFVVHLGTCALAFVSSEVTCVN